MENEYQFGVSKPKKVPNVDDSHNRKKTNKHVTTKTQTYARKSQPPFLWAVLESFHHPVGLRVNYSKL